MRPFVARREEQLSSWVVFFFSEGVAAAHLHISLQAVHVDRTVVFVPVLSLVVGGVAVLLLLSRPDAFLQLDETGHVRGEVVVLAARRWWLVAAILLVLVGHHLLDADHGLGFTDEWYLVGEERRHRSAQNRDEVALEWDYKSKYGE